MSMAKDSVDGCGAVAVSEPDDGGPAFPRQATVVGAQSLHRHDGMSLRDWVAGQALHAVYAHHYNSTGIDEVAGRAYDMADAMLAARLK